MNIEQYVNASGENKLTDNASMDYFTTAIQPRGYLGASRSKNLQTLNSILQWYNLKRASCLQAVSPDDPDSYLVKILVPISESEKSSLSGTRIGKIYLKLGYRDIVVKIPKERFKAFDKQFSDPGSIGCQNLYVVYCKNMLEAYKSANGGKLDDGFVDFRPECACFVPIPDEIKKTGINVSPLCVMPGCDNVAGVYLDPVSRGNRNCDLTICQSNINFSNLTAGGNINLQNKIVQTCGAEEEQISGVPAPKPVTPKNLISDIPVLSQINETEIGKYINTKYDKNATVYALGASSLIIFCFIVLFIIVVFFLF
jgi:hypothetical protein